MTVLYVDLYSSSFTRLMVGGATAPAGPFTVALATTPGPVGELFPDLDAVPDGAAVWADFAGTLGKVHDAAGADLLGAELKSWIAGGWVLTADKDDTDPAHPVLRILSASSGYQLTAVAEPDRGRVKITASGWTGTASISCTAAGVPAYIVRGADPIPAGTPDPVVVYDYEAPLGVPLTYALTDDAGTVQADTYIAADTAWLCHPSLAYLNRPVSVEAQTDSTWEGTGTEFDVLGSPYPLVLTSVRNSRSGTLQLIVAVGTERFDLMNLLADGSLLLLRSPCASVDDSRWLHIRSVREEPLGDGAEYRRWTLDYRVGSRPPGGVLLDPSWTYDSLPPLHATYGDLASAFSDYYALRTHVPTPAPIGVGGRLGW